jgi:hypothetical protein
MARMVWWCSPEWHQCAQDEMAFDARHGCANVHVVMGNGSVWRAIIWRHYPGNAAWYQRQSASFANCDDEYADGYSCASGIPG